MYDLIFIFWHEAPACALQYLVQELHQMCSHLHAWNLKDPQKELANGKNEGVQSCLA